MYTEKYKPNSLKEYQYYFDNKDKEKVKKIEDWLKNWEKNKKPILIYSEPGTGKTTLVYLLAKEYNMNLIELNMYNINTLNIKEIPLYNVNGKKNLILIDDLDAILECKIKIDINALLETKAPLIITAGDKWSKHLKDVRKLIAANKIEELAFKINLTSYRNIIKAIILKEKLKIDPEDLERKIDLHYPDLRAFLNDLEINIDNKRAELSVDIIKILNYIINRTNHSYINTLRYIQENISSDEYLNILSMIEINIFNAYEGKEIIEAYKLLSEADLYIIRARKARYVGSYIARFIAGLSILKTKNKFNLTYKFPVKNYLNNLELVNLHMSKKKLAKYMKFIKLTI